MVQPRPAPGFLLPTNVPYGLGLVAGRMVLPRQAVRQAQALSRAEGLGTLSLPTGLIRLGQCGVRIVLGACGANALPFEHQA
jgi:hypothetical protein